MRVRIQKGKDADIRKGFPWLYAGDLIESSEWLLAEPGSQTLIEDHKGAPLAVGYLNPKSQITCRVLALGNEKIDTDFFIRKLQKALALRESKIGVAYCRLVHSESDGLPGLLIDRFGDTLVVQVGTAGMEKLMPLWMAALEEVIAPKAIVLRNDTASRKLEGLGQEVRVIKGNVPDLVEVPEYNTVFLADLLRGQKTGWFYDQRDNRKMIADLASGKTLLDVYSHSGGFGIPAAKAGATVTLVDSSKLALSIAEKAAILNDVTCAAVQGDAFEVMQRLAKEGKRYDIVLTDPPAFIKSKKDFASGMKGYEKVARHAAALVEKGGLLFVASCSHHATRGAFNNAVQDGIKKAGLSAEILKQTGAAPDHPRHPMLAQSEYLKGLLLKLT